MLCGIEKRILDKAAKKRIAENIQSPVLKSDEITRPEKNAIYKAHNAIIQAYTSEKKRSITSCLCFLLAVALAQSLCEYT